MTLAVNQLRLSYGSREVLRVAELQFEPTSMVCLIGPTAAVSQRCSGLSQD